MSNVHVMLIYGGQSSEHDVSLASARNVFAALDDTHYDVSTCLIDREGRWWLLDTIGDDHAGSPQLLPVLGQKKFVTIPDHRIIQPDVLFPMLHGKHGEDGTVQGLAELLGIPIAGPGTLGAALTMDKDVTKRVLQQAGIPVVKDMVWHTRGESLTYQDVKAQLGDVIFVKPSRSGSSMGVSRVTDEKSFVDALELASHHDSIVLIEEAVRGNELQVAVLGNENPRVTDICEIVMGAEFHDFEDKYNPDSAAQFFIPARISDELTAQIKQYTRDAYVATRCRGLARVDFFLSESGEVYLNEINAIPGFTSVSVYPKLFRHDGVAYPQLIARLIDLALE